MAEQMPLPYYKKTTWNVIRNDALDRFETPFEQHFKKDEIRDMMGESVLQN